MSSSQNNSDRQGSMLPCSKEGKMLISRALLSVSDKTGITEFAEFLHSNGVELISTGGTAKMIRDKGIPVKDISEITQFPEMLDGRVKTLHPAIHGGLLFVRGNDEHEKTVEEHKIGAIDLVVVNLYPFEETVARGASEEEVIENIDIGGPSMLRSASKNFASVTVVCDAADYSLVQKEIEQNGETSFETRKKLAAKVFQKTAQYDAAIAHYFTPEFTPHFSQKISDLRYGENPHQIGEFHAAMKPVVPSLPQATKHQGKEMGYCNILDADAALQIILEFPDTPAATIIKHTNPCGTALGSTIEEAYDQALEADPVSAFGGIVALNRKVEAPLAKKLTDIFLEIIIAPEYSEEALEILKSKKNLRVYSTGEMKKPLQQKELRSVLGGYLIQGQDEKDITESDIETVVGNISDEEMKDLLFAWKVCKHVKSNAIVLVKDGQTVGVGAGQMSRVESSRIALSKAGEKAKGAVAASDAFFPFADGVEFLGNGGVSAVIQPGGSRNDAEVFEATEKMGMKMVLTGTRAFKH